MQDYTPAQRGEALSRGIYLGHRGSQFASFIEGLLTRANLKPHYIHHLLTSENMREYSKAFTAVTANSRYNYEVYEQLGDLSINKFVVSCAYKRYPFLVCTEGVKVAARLRIKYSSKYTLADQAKRLGFWDFISALEVPRNEKELKEKIKSRQTRPECLLEDCFEAFIGCTEQLIDKKYRIGVGYAVVYDILHSVWEKVPMPLSYVSLYDAKTRMKEIFDKNPKLGKWKITTERVVGTEQQKGYTVAMVITWNGAEHFKYNGIIVRDKKGAIQSVLAEAQGPNKDQAEQAASAVGIRELARRGYRQVIKEDYKLFAQGKNPYTRSYPATQMTVPTVKENAKISSTDPGVSHQDQVPQIRGSPGALLEEN